MVNGQDEWDEAERELVFVTVAVRATVSRLLRQGEVHPRLVARLLARVAGELGTVAALASGMGVEVVLDELADAMRRVGREQHSEAGLAARPTSGNA